MSVSQPASRLRIAQPTSAGEDHDGCITPEIPRWTTLPTLVSDLSEERPSGGVRQAPPKCQTRKCESDR